MSEAKHWIQFKQKRVKEWKPEELGAGGGGGRRLRRREENREWAPWVISLWAGSTSFEIQPLLLVLGFLSAAGGRSYGVVWVLREGRLRNLPPVPPSYGFFSFPSVAIAVRSERERNANAGQIRVLIVERERERERERIINNTEYRVIKLIK